MLEILHLMSESSRGGPSEDLRSASDFCYFSGDPKKPSFYKQGADTCSTSVPSFHLPSEALLMLLELSLLCSLPESLWFSVVTSGDKRIAKNLL